MDGEKLERRKKDF